MPRAAAAAVRELDEPQRGVARNRGEDGYDRDSLRPLDDDAPAPKTTKLP